MTVPLVSVVGWHNAGKTTFVEGLLAELKRRGLRVAIIKHSRGGFEIDRPGTDTWRYAQAGSDVVAISGRSRLALIERRTEELSLAEVVARLPEGIDLVITEGYKAAPTPKIEVTRAGASEGRVVVSGELLALVTDDAKTTGDGLPCFHLADAEGVADFLEARGLIRPRR